MAVPSGLVLVCEQCGEVPHRVLRGRVGGRNELVFEGVVKCSQCGRVRSVVTRQARPRAVPIIVSWLGRSVRTSLEFASDERVHVGDTVDLPMGRARITAIETGGRRVKTALARAVQALWAVRADKVRIAVSVTLGNRTVTRWLIAEPDDEFLVGEVLDVESSHVLVLRIRTRHRTLRTGSTAAVEIVRIYGRAIRKGAPS